MLIIRKRRQYKKDELRAIARGLDSTKLESIVDCLARDIPLHASQRDHQLKGEFCSFRECHISGDWLLIYRKHHNTLILELVRTGTHSDLFSK
jgi:mRNA interferase YafQ